MMTHSFQPHVSVRIKLLTTARGGRAEGIAVGEHRGILSARGQHFSFRAPIPAPGLMLGETITLEIEFIFPELALPFFKDKDEFNVWEGGIVGYGRVMKVLAPA